MQSNISKFFSDSPQHGQNIIFKRNAKLTYEEVGAIVAAKHCLTDEEKVTHILIRQYVGSYKKEVVLAMLAGEAPKIEDDDVGGEAPEKSRVAAEKEKAE